MNRIIDTRSTGKTRKLLELAKETGATVVCSNPTAMEYKAKNYGIVGLEFIDYEDYSYGNLPTKKYVVDELENLCGANIIGYSLTVD